MSLPSNAKYLDKDMKVVGYEFVNCGWSVTAHAIYQCLLELEKIPEDAIAVELYSIVVPIVAVRMIQGKISDIVEEAVLATLDDDIAESYRLYREENKHSEYKENK